MKKSVKVVPTMVLALVAVAAVGCNKKKPVYRNALEEYVAGLPDGELTEEQVNGLVAVSILSSADSEVKYSSYTLRDYTTCDYYYSTATDEDLHDEENYGVFQDLTKTVSFRQYDDGVTVARNNYTRYALDTTQRTDGTPEGISESIITSTCMALVPTKFSEETVLWQDGEEYNYLHTRNLDKNDIYSFHATTPVRDGLAEDIASSGALSAILANGFADVKDYYAEYESYYTSKPEYNYAFFKGVSATKSGSEVNLSWYGCMRYWWMDMDKKWPGEDLQGYYMERGKCWTASATIKDGFLYGGHATYDGVYRVYWHDAQGRGSSATAADPEVSQEFIDSLDLSIAYEIPDGKGGMQENGYCSYTSLEGGSYGTVYELIAQNNKSLGNYYQDLPEVEGYRVNDPTDIGSEYYPLSDFLDE